MQIIGQRTSKDVFVVEVEVWVQQTKTSEIVIEGEYVSESKMLEWGWTENLVCQNRILLRAPIAGVQ